MRGENWSLGVPTTWHLFRQNHFSVSHFVDGPCTLISQTAPHGRKEKGEQYRIFTTHTDIWWFKNQPMFFSFRHTKHTQISLIFAIAKITRQCSLKNNHLLSQVYSFTGQFCSDELVVVFVEFQTGGANRENTECPLMEKLRNINTHNISSLPFNICINWPL